ncbi:MAG: hypothetical protein OXJ37_00935 [Bryobacterales bacterium]|nr:hypothetical protein [Bryobacterales bacterium]
MASKRGKGRKRRRMDGKSSSNKAQPASRAGSHAGRGFRYQDAVSVWLAVEVWTGHRPSATVLPEGGDDIEMRGALTTFVQVKSRREHLGGYSAGEAARHIGDLWARGTGSSPQPGRSELILERSVAGLTPASDGMPNVAGKGPLLRELKRIGGWEALLSRTTISVVTDPQEASIKAISERTGSAPLAAQMCFAELLKRVGGLADENGTRQPEEYVGLSASDTEGIVSDVLRAVDVDAIERAIGDGVCQPVDFLTPIDDPRFYLGVDVEPGHVAAGLVSERPAGRLAIERGLKEQRAALVVGPSGAGKSALMWEAANALRHTVRWFRVRKAGSSDMPSIRQLMRTFRASKDSPLGFVIDDVGRTGPETWDALLREAAAVPGVVVLGSIREEDVVLISERSRIAEVRAEGDDELAQRLWQELRDEGKTEWPGWREPWNTSNGLLLEYVHMLTQGRRMEQVLRDQVAARVLDPARVLELDVLRCGAWAGTADAELDVSRLAGVLDVTEAEIARALLRLVEEHLVRSPTAGVVAGLHRLRSEKLLGLTHEAVLPTLATSFARTVASVPAKDIEPLVADAVSESRLDIAPVVDGLAGRLEGERDPLAMAAALRGLGTGRVWVGVDEWLATPEAGALPKTQIGIAGMLDLGRLGDLGLVPEVQAATRRLAMIRGPRTRDPRCLLVDRLSEEAVSAHVEAAESTSLEEILASLVDMPISDVVRSALRDVPADLASADLKRVAPMLRTLSTIDRRAALCWVEKVGQEELFGLISKEVPWAGPVTIGKEDGATVVGCDLWYVAPSKQKDAHGAVVELCELMLALCPSADVARSRAITSSGVTAGVSGYAIADKRIPRENLPPPCVVQWNRRWWELIARRVAAPSYSDYLARATAILNALVPTLHRVFDAHLRGKDVPTRLVDKLNSLNEATQALTPPAVSAYDASGTGDREVNKSVTRFQNVLISASVNVVKRFVRLPDGAGAYIGWLNGLIADTEAAVNEEPWELLAGSAPEALGRLKSLLATLRSLAGEAHERNEQPARTWIDRAKRAQRGNAIRVIGGAAKASADKRLRRRKARMEREARGAGLIAVFHVREEARGALPWPPFEVLALVPAGDLPHAAATVEESIEPLRRIVDGTTRLTIVPVIDGVAIAALGQSGYQTLYPGTDSVAEWLDYVGVDGLQSDAAESLGQVLGLAVQLGAMDSRGLGLAGRPLEEREVRERLEEELGERRTELEQQLRRFDRDLGERIVGLLAAARAGKVDYMAEVQDGLDGVASPLLEEAGYLTLCMLEEERGGRAARAGGGGSA